MPNAQKAAAMTVPNTAKMVMVLKLIVRQKLVQCDTMMAT
jgi:hypothetical protein